MSQVGSILATVANFIPVVGPIVGAGIGIADKVIDGKKEAEAQNELTENAEMNARRKSFLEKENVEASSGNLLNSQYSGKMPEIPESKIPLLGTNTLMGNKFGVSNNILGQAMNLETLKL